MWLWRMNLDGDSELEGRWFGSGVLGANTWQMCWEVIEALMAVWKMQVARLASGAGACNPRRTSSLNKLIPHMCTKQLII